jgi:hypothetical protein
LYFSISNILGELSKDEYCIIYKLFINLLLYYINKLTACNFFHIAVLGVFYNIAYSINIHRNFAIQRQKKIRCSPTQNTCPDGWMFNSRGMPNAGVRKRGAITIGRHNRDKQPDKSNGCGVLCPNQPTGCRTGKTAICAKHAWANNGVTWDGVSNYNSCK